MKKLLLVLLAISALVGTGLSAWYIGTKQTSHSEFVEPVVGDFSEELPTDQETPIESPETTEPLEY